MQRALQLPESADQVLVCVNPKAGSGPAGQKVRGLADLLNHAGWQVTVDDHLARVATEANRLHREQRLRALVAAGGDGTAAELVNRTDEGVPITLLPLGTANLLAKYLGFSGATSVADAIITGKLLRLDAGRADRRLFLVMATCGIDADIVQRLHDQREGHIRRWSYLKPMLDSIRSYQYPALRLYFTAEAAGDTAEAADNTAEVARTETVSWMSLFNLPCYGAGFRFTPQAVGLDGLLDLCSFQSSSTFGSLRYLAGVVLGHHQRMRGCIATRVREVTVEADAPVPYQLDGDPGGQLPCRFEVLPGRLSLVVPSDCPRLPR